MVPLERVIAGVTGQLTKIWETDDKVCEDEDGRAIQTICTVFNVGCMVFEVAWDVCHSHERHERPAVVLSRSVILLRSRSSTYYGIGE